MNLKILVFTTLLAFLMSCGEESKVKILKLAHVLDTTHPVHKAMEFMAEKVKENSKGLMRVDIYPSSQLGGERETIELLQIGSLAMTKVSASPMETFVPEMKIFSVPYVFRDEEHLWKTLESDIGKKLLLAGQKFRLRGLCYYDAGSRSFYTKDKQVVIPADLKGLKIRVMKSNTAVDMVKALGGSATPIPWGELYTALQQGVVDGAENNPPSFFLSKHYEVCKYYTLDEHTSVPDILLVSTEIWEDLTEQQQKWLQDAVDKSIPYEKILWKESSDASLEEVQKAGVTVLRPDKTLFREQVEPLHDSYKGTPVYELLQEIQKIQ
ncbi:MAG: TRAP transporter substrate-binding protein [Calditrichaceae bacterium]|nr:TRAP transporter substrate-binding protein [Calditrichaceae bacterium]MBN2708179.1 TRAP transporter substrate-binding protein [Calditrichaceae bacterium]